MKFQLERLFFKDSYTIGNFFVDFEKEKSWEYLFNMLEPQNRDFNKDGDLKDPGEGKINGKTAIPFGTYKFKLIQSPCFKMKVPLLLDVPGFTSVEIHIGNKAKDTRACLLPGNNLIKGKVLHSTECFEKLMALLEASGQTEWKLEII